MSVKNYTFAPVIQRSMKIITLTTDFGLRDYSVGAVKGALYSKCPEACIVDISHLVSPFDIFQTAYILKNAYKHFPEGSIHIIGVDAERTPEKRHLLMLLNGHYFIGADNGIFHLLADNKSHIELYDISASTPPTLFPTLYYFPLIAEQLCKGVPATQIGTPTDKYVKANYFNPQISTDNNHIYGIIVYIDHYGNGVTNIGRELFESVRQGRSFEVIVGFFSFQKIYNRYSEILNFKVPSDKRALMDGEKMLIFNELDMLQFSIYKSDSRTVGGASSLLGINYQDKVSVRFY